MSAPRFRDFISHPLFRVGLVVQTIAAATILAIMLSMRIGWIDVVALGLEGGIDEPSPRLGLWTGVISVALFVFVSAFGLYAGALHQIKKHNKARLGSPLQTSLSSSREA